MDDEIRSNRRKFNGTCDILCIECEREIDVSANVYIYIYYVKNKNGMDNK